MSSTTPKAKDKPPPLQQPPLPADLLLKIFRYIDLFDLFNCAPVCKDWLSVAKSALLLVDSYKIRFGSFNFDPEFKSSVILPAGYMGSLHQLYNVKYKREEKKVLGAWSLLFNGNKASQSSHAFVLNEEPDLPTEIDEALKQPLSELMPKIKLEKKDLSVVPRGLNNPDNKCFLNSALQSLMGCDLFCSFLDELKLARITKQSNPYLDLFTRFYKEFKPWEKRNSSQGFPFTPTYFYGTLAEFNPIATTWQEDAQEYLCFLLDKIHSEIVKASPRQKKQSVSDEGWRGVKGQGGKNRSTILLSQFDEFEESIITDIFGGIFSSTVYKKGTDATEKTEPFFCIHLDIHHDYITTLQEAFDFLTQRETIEGFQNMGSEISAQKQLTIKKLPQILIIHLKRFTYDMQTYAPIKIRKMIKFPLHLKPNPEWLSKRFKAPTYELFTVISHLGVQTTGGHYTADIFHSSSQKWLRFDDSKIYPIEDEKSVLNNSNAYLLFYQKST